MDAEGIPQRQARARRQRLHAHAERIENAVLVRVVVELAEDHAARRQFLLKEREEGADGIADAHEAVRAEMGQLRHQTVGHTSLVGTYEPRLKGKRQDSSGRCWRRKRWKSRAMASADGRFSPNGGVSLTSSIVSSSFSTNAFTSGSLATAAFTWRS